MVRPWPIISVCASLQGHWQHPWTLLDGEKPERFKFGQHDVQLKELCGMYARCNVFPSCVKHRGRARGLRTKRSCVRVPERQSGNIHQDSQSTGDAGIWQVACRYHMRTFRCIRVTFEYLANFRAQQHLRHCTRSTALAEDHGT